MNGTCQTCGTIAPLTWFLSEVDRRQICAVLAKIPKEVEEVVFHYLSLFRPDTGKALQGRKAIRLLSEIRDIVATGYVHVHGRADRNCQPPIWAKAMEQMVERRNSLSLPLPDGHIYLCKVAWDMAEQVSRQTETKNEAARTHTRTRSAEERNGLDPLEAARRRFDEEHGFSEENFDMSKISTIIKGME